LENLKESSQQKKGTLRLFSIPIHLTRQTIIIIALAVAAFSLKFYLLDGRFLYLDPDEAYYLILARNLIVGNGFTFNGLPNIIFPPFLPLLIALFYLIGQSFQYSLFIITALSGTLIGIISYRIAEKKFSSFIPVLGAFLVLFIYQLNDFLPLYNTPYVSRLYRGSDILNCFLILISVYFVLRLVEKDKYTFAALAGSFFAFSYLTRPEGILLLGLILVCLTLLKFVSLISISYKRLLVFLCAFLFFSFPYILYLRNTTGKWMLSGKTSSAQVHRETLLEVIENDNWDPFTEVHYSYNSENMEMNQAYWGFHDKLEITGKISFQSYLKNIPENLKMYVIIPKTLLPHYIMVFFLLGLGSAIYRIIKRRSVMDVILLMLIPYSLMIEALAYPFPRHHLFLVPLFCIYAIEGIVLISSTLAKNKRVVKRIILILLFSIIALFIGYEYKNNLSINHLKVTGFKRHHLVDFTVSQYLKKRNAQTIMSAHPSFAVRAVSDWQVLPKASVPEIIRFGKHKDVDYAILPDPEGNINFYYIVDMKNSDIPEDSKEGPVYTIIERGECYNLINFVKKK